jgi:hypothetical protein
MELTFGGIAFAGLIVAQFLAVVAVLRARLRDESGLSAMALHRKFCQPHQPRPRFDETFDLPSLPISTDRNTQVTSTG